MNTVHYLRYPVVYDRKASHHKHLGRWHDTCGAVLWPNSCNAGGDGMNLAVASSQWHVTCMSLLRHKVCGINGDGTILA